MDGEVGLCLLLLIEDLEGAFHPRDGRVFVKNGECKRTIGRTWSWRTRWTTSIVARSCRGPGAWTSSACEYPMLEGDRVRASRERQSIISGMDADVTILNGYGKQCIGRYAWGSGS